MTRTVEISLPKTGTGTDRDPFTVDFPDWEYVKENADGSFTVRVPVELTRSGQPDIAALERVYKGQRWDTRSRGA
jgi:hypothetical protein